MAGVNSKSDVLRNNQRFSEKYSTKWPCITASKRGDFYAYCETCSCDISIKHSGQYDIKLHIQTAKHVTNVNAQASDHFKNSTEFRPNLGRRLLESLMVTKTYRQSTNHSCYNQEFSENLLQSAKSATHKSLKKDEISGDVAVTDVNMNIIDPGVLIE